MKGKGSRLAIVLALILTLVGAFSATSFAHTDGQPHTWAFKSHTGSSVTIICTDNCYREAFKSDGVGTTVELQAPANGAYGDDFTATIDLSAFNNENPQVTYGTGDTPNSQKIRYYGTTEKGKKYDKNTVPTAPGTYQASTRVWIGDDQTSESVVLRTAEFTIVKSDGTATAPEAIDDTPYTGRPINLIKTPAKTTSNGEIQYRVMDLATGEFLGKWSDTATATNAGTYRIYTRVLETDYYNRIPNGKIAKDDVTIQAIPLTVEADNAEKVMGTNDPDLTFKVYSDGVLVEDGEDLFEGKLDRDDGENPGLYRIKKGDLDLTEEAAVNYSYDPDADFTQGWFRIVDEVTVDFDANGASGEMDPIVANLGDAVEIPECTFTSDGVVFVEWNTEKDGEGEGYDPGDEVEFTDNTTLYAIWKEHDTHSWKFDINDNGDGGEIYCTEPGCEYDKDHAFEVSISAEGGVYDTNPYEAEVKVTPSIPDELKGQIWTSWSGNKQRGIKYEGGDLTAPLYDEGPVDAGVYTASTCVWTGKGKWTVISTEFTIDRAELTVSGLKAKDKTYDATKTAAQDTSSPLVFEDSDGLVVLMEYTVSSDGLFRNKNAGSRWADFDVTITGDEAKNYKLAGATEEDPCTASVRTDKKATISPRNVYVRGIVAKDKDYDGTTDVELDISNAGFYNIYVDPIPYEGDKLRLKSATGTFKDKDAGEGKDVLITAVELGGKDKDNYKALRQNFDGDVAYEKTTADINKVALTATAGDWTVTYGDDLTGLKPGVTYDGFVNSESDGVLERKEDVTYSYISQKDGSEYEPGSPVGDYDIIPDVSVITADNYTIPEKNVTYGTLTVVPKEVTFEWYVDGELVGSDGVDVTYDGEDHIITAEPVELVDSDGVTAHVTGTDSARDVAATKYTAKVDRLQGEKKDNYYYDDDPEVTELDWNIKKADLDIFPLFTIITYGDDPENSGVIYDGLVPSDKDTEGNIRPGVLNGQIKYKYHVVNDPEKEYKAGDDVDLYEIDITDSETTARNYNLTFRKGGLFVARKHVTFKWDKVDPSKVYDGEPLTVTATTDDIIDQDLEEAYVAVAYDQEGSNTATDVVNAQKTTAFIDNTGKTEKAKNYNVDSDSNAKNTITITKRPVEVVWQNKGPYTYNGAEQSVSAIIKGAVTGQKLTPVTGGTWKATDAGSYVAEVTDFDAVSPAKKANYELTTADRSLTWQITPATVTVTAKDQTIYNTANYDNTAVSYAGFVGGDTEAVLTAKPTVSSDYTLYAKAGKYTLTPGGAAARSYTFKYKNGTLTVKEKATVLVARAVSTGSNTVNVRCTNYTGADRYIVRYGECGPESMNDTKVLNYSTKAVDIKGLKKGKTYKMIVYAQKNVNGSYQTIAKSNGMHVIAGTSNAKNTNPGMVTLSRYDGSMPVGSTYDIKASVSKARPGKALLGLNHGPKLTYVSSNNNVAKVSSSGRVYAVGKGTCRINVISISGVYKYMYITVR